MKAVGLSVAVVVVHLLIFMWGESSLGAFSSYGNGTTIWHGRSVVAVVLTYDDDKDDDDYEGICRYYCDGVVRGGDVDDETRPTGCYS